MTPLEKRKLLNVRIMKHKEKIEKINSIRHQNKQAFPIKCLNPKLDLGGNEAEDKPVKVRRMMTNNSHLTSKMKVMKQRSSSRDGDLMQIQSLKTPGFDELAGLPPLKRLSTTQNGPRFRIP
eukprot:CAMPEP_0170512564 /NCGR_PEP_ID=MMETSP0208-20121228/66921_1 /TAXON_ID=197538 /ORGANISM="Strombidium inclinatum, Strain S3" /LENGTH=121 /DNA_ID=CAMNT_0010796207 /DNA_START=134 /DNA_END=499 /DNA_ORIENTATION=-